MSTQKKLPLTMVYRKPGQVGVPPRSHEVSTIQPKLAAPPQVKRPPQSPPVYQPQNSHKVLQPKAAQIDTQARLPTVAPAAYRPQLKVLQAKSAGQSPNVIQLKGACLVCKHKHGASECPTLIQDGTDEKGAKKYRKCGCKSHSSKFDSGSKFNPGSNKRERMLANKGSKTVT
jgi:hypothetical protein